MDDNFVNELFMKIEQLTAENTEKDSRLTNLVEQMTKLEKDNNDL